MGKKSAKAKQSLKDTSSTTREANGNHTIIRPNLVAANVANIVGGARSVPRTLLMPKKTTPTMDWSMIDEISFAIGQSIAEMAQSIDESVQMVRNVGCEHPLEFDILVKKTNEDLTKFAEDYARVKEQHKGKSGPILDEVDNMLSIQVFENYLQFRAHFDGTMHHTVISFTEFALEAKDRAKTLLEKKEAEAQIDAPAEPQLMTEEQK